MRGHNLDALLALYLLAHAVLPLLIPILRAMEPRPQRGRRRR